jgi:hypothetical protein
MEKPTMDEVGRAFLAEEPGEADEDAGWRRDAQDFFTGGTAGAAAGSGTGTEGASSSAFFSSEGADESFSEAGVGVTSGLASVEIDVFVVAGDPGIVGVSALSVTADDGTVELVCECGTASNRSVVVSRDSTALGSFFFAARGDMGGVFESRASSTTLGGGQALGEMMIPGACDGSRGLRDQMAKEMGGDGSVGSEVAKEKGGEASVGSVITREGSVGSVVAREGSVVGSGVGGKDPI